MFSITNYIENAQRMFFDKEYDSCKFFIAVSSIFWSACLFFSEGLFGTPIYYYMAAVADEFIWSIAYLTHGILSLFVIFSGCRNPFLRILSPLSGLLVWSGASICMVMTGYPIAAAVPNIVGSMALWWILIRTKTN